MEVIMPDAAGGNKKGFTWRLQKKGEFSEKKIRPLMVNGPGNRNKSHDGSITPLRKDYRQKLFSEILLAMHA